MSTHDTLVPRRLETPGSCSVNGALGADLVFPNLVPDAPEETEILLSERETLQQVGPARPTVIYDLYWQFAVKRQAIYLRRVNGEKPPWTEDPILRKHKFTNAYRASDRTSQYLIRHVIYNAPHQAEDLVFRILLFKIFNRIETWELLESKLGEISYSKYAFEDYDTVLTQACERKQSIYSGAYIMPSGGALCTTGKKHRMHLELLDAMMRDKLPKKLEQATSLRQVFQILRSYPTLGDFLAYQYAIDLNYSSLLDFSEMDFVVPGPGALSGIHKCFHTLGGLTEADIIRVVTERQDAEFERLGLKFKSLWGRSLQLIDCQNLFCEIDKYSRVSHPELAHGRTRIKQMYRMTEPHVVPWYPPKWGLNDKIAQETCLLKLKKANHQAPTLSRESASESKDHVSLF